MVVVCVVVWLVLCGLFVFLVRRVVWVMWGVGGGVCVLVFEWWCVCVLVLGWRCVCVDWPLAGSVCVDRRLAGSVSGLALG